ncbi:hypothetical protein ACILG0_18030 [Pseudomonadota bacterium AL_CKDN230030165-1A_HGKHYDSX7]
MQKNPLRAFARPGKTWAAGLYALALGFALTATSPASAQADLPPRGGASTGSQAPASAPSPDRLPSRAPANQPAQAPAQTQPQSQAPAAGQSGQRTQVNDDAAYERLLNNSGIGLQWFWTDERGKLNAVDDNGVIRLDGGYATAKGSLKLKGEVLSISADRFTFRGTILIVDVPDKGRRCERTGDYEFRATGKRKYWRLQQMTECDRLTDYVDIYY